MQKVRRSRKRRREKKHKRRIRTKVIGAKGLTVRLSARWSSIYEDTAYMRVPQRDRGGASKYMGIVTEKSMARVNSNFQKNSNFLGNQ